MWGGPTEAQGECSSEEIGSFPQAELIPWQRRWLNPALRATTLHHSDHKMVAFGGLFFHRGEGGKAALEPGEISAVTLRRMTGCCAKDVTFMVHLPRMAGNHVFYKPAQLVFVFTFFLLFKFPDKPQSCCWSSE